MAATKSLSIYEGFELQFFSDACISFCAISKTCYYQAITRYANIKLNVAQYGDFYNYSFNTDSHIPASVKEVIRPKFDTYLNYLNEATGN